MNKTICQPKKHMSLAINEMKREFLSYFWNHTKIVPATVQHRIFSSYCEESQCLPKIRVKRFSDDTGVDPMDGLQSSYEQIYTGNTDNSKKNVKSGSSGLTKNCQLQIIIIFAIVILCM